MHIRLVSYSPVRSFVIHVYIELKLPHLLKILNRAMELASGKPLAPETHTKKLFCIPTSREENMRND